MKSTFDEFLADLIKEENERVRKETEERVKRETEERVKKETEERVRKETEILWAKEMLTDGIEINLIAKWCKELTLEELALIQKEVQELKK